MTRYDGPWTLQALLEDRARRLGDRTALATRDERLTYAEVRDRAARVGGYLADLGVVKGDRVATMMGNSTAYTAAWHGAAWAGAIDVPVNTELKGTFLEHVLRDAGASVMVLEGRFVERLQGLDLPDLRHVVVVDAPEFAEALAHDPVPPVPTGPHDALYVIYTSGTTGPSKGVVHTNLSAMWYVQPHVEQLAMSERDVVYTNFPLFHQMGRSAMVTTAFWCGAAAALRPRFSIADFWDDVAHFGVTVFAYLGTTLDLLLARPESPQDRGHTLRIAFGAGAGPETKARFTERFGVPLLENYGSTEATTPGSARVEDLRHDTMGRPPRHLIVAIHDEHDHPLPPGSVGEIVVRPKEPGSIFQGYWGRPAETLHAFRNFWFHSGDAGYLTEDGHLVFVDRLKDAIRRRGENISSFEVEQALALHPDVLECAAYAVTVDGDDEVMVAVVPIPGATPKPEDLFDHCVATMPRFAVPRFLRIVTELPKNASQRVQKHLLRAEGVTADTARRDP